jgi:flagellar biosynthesis anti-sigma factor FlgM
MRIDPKLVTPIGPRDPRDQKATSKASTGSEPAAVVSLSSASATAAEHVSGSVAERIAKIRSAIEAGSYPIDLDALASRIVDDEVVRGR